MTIEKVYNYNLLIVSLFQEKKRMGSTEQFYCFKYF